VAAADVYANDGAGGPVDYVTPAAALADGTLAWTSPALADGSDWTFAVRLRGPAGLRERNADARVRVRVGAGGALLPDLPDPPAHPAAVAESATALRVTWAFRAAAGPAPSAFGVWVVPGTTPSAAGPPALAVPAVAGRHAYSARLAGLAAATAHAVAVAALAGPAYGPAATCVAATPAAAGPAAVDGLAAAATPFA
jgi:hypothetical protein